MPTPARWATSRTGTSTPPAASRSRAAATSAARLRRASTRAGTRWVSTIRSRKVPEAEPVIRLSRTLAVLRRRTGRPELRMPDEDAVLASPDRLVRDHQRTHGTHEGEGSEGRDRDGRGGESEQDDGADRPPPEDTADRSLQEADVREQVERRAPAERHGRHGVKLRADVVNRGLEAEREEHDARDHWQVEVVVRVAREPRPLDAARLHQPPTREYRSDVEVEPPQRRNDDDPECCGNDHARAQLE